MKRIASVAAAGALVAVSAVGIATGASADEPSYPPKTPKTIAATTAPATQVVSGVETETLAQTGAGDTTSLLAASVGLVAVGGAAVAYARRRKGAHEA